MFSSLFWLTFVPGLLVGFINAKYRHKVAAFVWIVPAAILVYKVVVFPTSILQDHWSLALHYYFAGDFIVPQFHSYQQLFAGNGAGSDMMRGMKQLDTTGVFYASLGYSLSAVGAPYLKRSQNGIESNELQK